MKLSMQLLCANSLDTFQVTMHTTMPVNASALEQRRNCEKRHLDFISFLNSSVIRHTQQLITLTANR